MIDRFGFMFSHLWLHRFSVATWAGVVRMSYRCTLIIGILGVSVPAVASSAEVFDDWRDGDLVAQTRPDSREALLWSAAGSRYTHIGIVRLTGGGPYVLDLTTSASEVPVDDFIARGTGLEYAIYRVSHLSHRLSAGAVEAAWRLADHQRDEFLTSDQASLTDTGIVHRAFKAVDIDLGFSQRIGDLHISPARLRHIIMKDWQRNPTCSSVIAQPTMCWNVLKNVKIIPIMSVLNDSRVSRVYEGKAFNAQSEAVGAARHLVQ